MSSSSSSAPVSKFRFNFISSSEDSNSFKELPELLQSSTFDSSSNEHPASLSSPFFDTVPFVTEQDSTTEESSSVNSSSSLSPMISSVLHFNDSVPFYRHCTFQGPLADYMRLPIKNLQRICSSFGKMRPTFTSFSLTPNPSYGYSVQDYERFLTALSSLRRVDVPSKLPSSTYHMRYVSESYKTYKKVKAVFPVIFKPEFMRTLFPETTNTMAYEFNFPSLVLDSEDSFQECSETQSAFLFQDSFSYRDALDLAILNATWPLAISFFFSVIFVPFLLFLACFLASTFFCPLFTCFLVSFIVMLVALLPSFCFCLFRTLTSLRFLYGSYSRTVPVTVSTTSPLFVFSATIAPAVVSFASLDVVSPRSFTVIVSFEYLVQVLITSPHLLPYILTLTSLLSPSMLTILSFSTNVVKCNSLFAQVEYFLSLTLLSLSSTCPPLIARRLIVLTLFVAQLPYSESLMNALVSILSALGSRCTLTFDFVFFMRLVLLSTSYSSKFHHHLLRLVSAQKLPTLSYSF